MKCKRCKSSMEESVIDLITYYTCADCGKVFEIQTSELDDPVSIAISKFEEKYSVDLPRGYKAFLQRGDLQTLRSDSFSFSPSE